MAGYVTSGLKAHLPLVARAEGAAEGGAGRLQAQPVELLPAGAHVRGLPHDVAQDPSRCRGRGQGSHCSGCARVLRKVGGEALLELPASFGKGPNLFEGVRTPAKERESAGTGDHCVCAHACLEQNRGAQGISVEQNRGVQVKVYSR